MFTMVPTEFEFLRNTGQIRWQNQIIAGPGGDVLWSQAGNNVFPADIANFVGVGVAAPVVGEQFAAVSATGIAASIRGAGGGFPGAVIQPILQIADPVALETSLLMTDGSAAAGAGAGTGAIRYNDGATAKRFEKSVDGGTYQGLAGAMMFWGAGAVDAAGGLAAGTFFLPAFGAVSGAGPSITGFGPFPGVPPASGGSGDVGLVMPARGRVRRMSVDATTPGSAEAVTVYLLKFAPETIVTSLASTSGISPVVDFPFAVGDVFQVAWTQAARVTASANILVTVYFEFDSPEP